MSEVIRSIIDDIRSGDSTRLERGLLLAYFVLEQHSKYSAYRDATESERQGPSTSQSEMETWLSKIRNEYETYSRLGLLPERYLGVVLSREEVDSLVGTLLEHIQDTGTVANNAIGAIAVSGSLLAVPGLANLVRERATEDSQLARDAIHAISKILRENYIVPAKTLSPEEKQTLQTAMAAMHFAQSAGMDGPLRARQQAALELASLLSTERG